jgi:hypothetical protein
LEKIEVRGTRLPAESIINLSGLKVGDKVNDLIVNNALHKITATGLVKTVDYAYDVYPDRPTAVLELTVGDERPLLPARIEPQADAEALWKCLQADPIFTRELPRTEKALAFYSAAVESCLRAQGRSDEYAASSVMADASGNAQSIIFRVRRYKELPPSKR